MATDGQPTTFSDLKDNLVYRLREISSSGSTTETHIESMLNTALYDLHVNPGHNFPWAIRRGTLITHAPYTTGTVSIATSARTTVTGSGTGWNTAVTGFGFNNTRPGGKMTFAGSNDVHTVTTVTGDTTITLENMWVGDTLSAANYTYYEDEYALAADFGRPIDLRLFSPAANIPLIGPMEFRRMYPRNNVTGIPRVATLIENIGFSGSTAPRPRVLLAPAPDDERSIPYDYVTIYLAVSSTGTEQGQMTAATDEPIIPLKYRHILVLHALYNFLRDRKDDSRKDDVKAEYLGLLTRMTGEFNIGADRARIRPRNIHSYGRYWRQRYSADSRFDEIRDRY